MREGQLFCSFMFSDRRSGKDREASMLLGWLKKDEERRDCDEQAHDEASVALLSKSADHEFSKRGG